MVSDRSAVKLRGDGVDLAADVYGDAAAPPVLLLHGGGQTRHAWGTAAAAIAQAGRCAISIDLRGHGHSDWSPDGSYGIGQFADDVKALSSRLGSRPALVGASLGGLASLVAVGESTEPVATALVLVDVAPRLEREGRDKIQGFMRAGMSGFDTLEDAADSIAAFIPHRPRPSDLSGLRKNLRQRGDGRWYWHWDPRWITNREGVDGQEGIVNHERLCAAARNVTIPTLLVRGRMSDIVSDESVRELRELVPHAEVVDVAGAGHMVAGDKNDAFNAAVIEFVGRSRR
jgi:pimeloyl-ACP methyl ester carboxylesterase